LRYLEQERSFLQTINLSGVRDEWDAGQTIAGNVTQSFLPGFIIAFPLNVALVPVIPSPDTNILALCAIQFKT